MMLGMWMVTAAVWSAECSTRYSAEQLVQSLGLAESSYAEMDDIGFQLAWTEARNRLPCVMEPLTPTDAAQVHRVAAYAAFLDQDLPRATDYLAAMTRVQPKATLPSGVAPEGHPLRTAFDDARSRPEAPPLTLQPPAAGELRVDGERVNARPGDRPAVVQYIGADGAVWWTLQADAADALPAYPEVAPGEEWKLKFNPAWGVAAGAGAAAITSLVLYQGAVRAEERFYDQSDCVAGEDACYTRAQDELRKNHGLVLGSAATALAAAGLGVAAVLTW
ncbi:hypothetical protein L6R49_03840 [Myxococcota bacterium]|nr:hypothetical protein [Myxococcota bacterium]